MDPLSDLRAELEELKLWRAAALDAAQEVRWHEDTNVRVALEKLSTLLRRSKGDEVSDEQNKASLAFLAETLRSGCDALLSLGCDAVAREESQSSLMSLLRECDTSVRESWATLQRALPRGEGVGNELDFPSQSALPMEWGLRVACRGLAATASESVHWQRELVDILKATYRTLSAVDEDRGLHNTPMSSCEPASFSEYSQSPRLAAQVCGKLLHLRQVLSSEADLAAVSQQRSDLIRAIVACCGALRCAVPVNATTRAGALLSTDTLVTYEEAEGALRNVTALICTVLQGYVQAVERALDVLTPLAKVAADVAPTEFSPELLTVVTEGVRARVEQMERSQFQRLQERKWEEEEAVRIQNSLQGQLGVARERFEAAELALIDEQQKRSMLDANMALLQERWDTVAKLFGRFAEDVGAIVTLQRDPRPQHLRMAEVLALVRQAISLEDFREAKEALQDHFSCILDACEWVAAEHRSGEATIARMTQESDELHAAVKAGEQNQEKIKAQLQEFQKSIATIEAAHEARRESAARAQLVADRAHEEALDAGARERAALESRLKSAMEEVARLEEKLTLARVDMSATQDRLEKAEEREASQAADVSACLKALGQLQSLEEVVDLVAAYRLDHEKKSLEVREGCWRRELVQDWALTMVPSATEVHLLHAVVAGVSRLLPGTALVDLPAQVSRLSRELAEAERLLGAAVSAPCTEGATREALLSAVEKAFQLHLAVLPESSPDAAVSHGMASSTAVHPGAIGTGAVSPPYVGWGSAPSKLVGAMSAMIEERQDLHLAASGAWRTSERWYRGVARVAQTLRNALAAAGVDVPSTDDHSLMTAHPSAVSPDSQLSMLDYLEFTAQHLSEYTEDSARVFQKLRECLQDCLSSTESCIPTLVSAVVTELENLRVASRSASQKIECHDKELADLRTLLHEASAALPDSAPFLSTHSLSLVERCRAYTKECARLTSLESELTGIFSAPSVQSSWGRTSLSLGELAFEVQREWAKLREVVVPKLQRQVDTLGLEVLFAEERAARAILSSGELTGRLRSIYYSQQHDLRCLATEEAARAEAAKRQCVQTSAEHCTFLTAHESLVTAALDLVSVQEECRRSLGEGDLLEVDDPTCFSSKALQILKEEAVLVPRLLQAHESLAVTCAELRSDLNSVQVAHKLALESGQTELDISRGRSTELEGQLEHVWDALKSLSSVLLPDGQFLLWDVSCLPHLVEASAQLARTAAADAAARRRLEKNVSDASAAVAELQGQCNAAEHNLKALRETLRHYEQHEADEIGTLKCAVKMAVEAYSDMATELCLSVDSAQLPVFDAAAVSREQWAAAVQAVRAKVEEAARLRSDAQGIGAEVRILQCRMDALTAAGQEAESREGRLLQRANALLLSSVSLKAAVIELMPSHQLELQSLEDVALAMHAAVQLLVRQQDGDDGFLARGKVLHREVESLEGRLHDVVQERDMERFRLASLEKSHDMLQRKIVQLEQHVSDTFLALERRAAALLGPAELLRLNRSTPMDCLDGVVYLADVLASTAEEGNAAKLQLAARGAGMCRDEEARPRTPTPLSTLWQAFRTILLPQLVDEPAGCHSGLGSVVASLDSVEFLSSEAGVKQAVQVIVEAADCVRRTHKELQEVFASLRGHFGGDAPTTLTDASDMPPALTPVLHSNGTSSPRFNETVKAILHLVNTLVNSKCTSVKDFLNGVVVDVLQDVSGCARVSFSALRSGAFAEWLHNLLDSLRTLRDSSNRHRDRVQRLPAFMDALVEAIHSHGGRVDVTSSGATCASTTADLTLSYQNDHLVALEDSQAREQAAILDGLQALLKQQEDHVRALTTEWQDVMTCYHQLSQEQVAAEETVMELRRRVQFKVQEDHKLEASLRELDSHLDQQASELAVKYRADQDIIRRRFSTLRHRIHATVRPSVPRSASMSSRPSHCAASISES